MVLLGMALQALRSPCRSRLQTRAPLAPRPQLRRLLAVRPTQSLLQDRHQRGRQEGTRRQTSGLMNQRHLGTHPGMLSQSGRNLSANSPQ